MYSPPVVHIVHEIQNRWEVEVSNNILYKAIITLFYALAGLPWWRFRKIFVRF